MYGFSVKKSWAGFWITFRNGVTVSVQFGYGNYCKNRDNEKVKGWLLDSPECGEVSSEDAEVAVIYKERFITRMYKNEGDVLGWQTPEDVLNILNWASKLTEEKILAFELKEGKV